MLQAVAFRGAQFVYDCQRSRNSPRLRGCPSRNSPTLAVT
jgi:hypothetical protein